MNSDLKPTGRLDHWLRLRYPQLTRVQLGEALKAGLVRDGEGRALAKGTKLTEKVTVSTERLDTHLGRLRRGNASLDIPIVQQTNEWLIVDKPAGMPGHPLSLFDENTVTHWAFSRFPEIPGHFPASQPTLTPHRLDTGTSGLLVVARSPAAYAEWRGYFSAKLVEKEYVAWCWGHPDWQDRAIDLPLGHCREDARVMTTDSTRLREGARLLTAASQCRVEATFADIGITRIRVRCHTGVMHQVRAHLAAIGFPLVGDDRYDPQFFAREIQPAYHLLRAVELRTPHGDFAVTYQTDASLPVR